MQLLIDQLLHTLDYISIKKDITVTLMILLKHMLIHGYMTKLLQTLNGLH